MKSRQELSKDGLDCLYTVAGALFYGDNASAAAKFRSSWRNLDKDERKSIRDLINHEILFAKELEISAHGIKRSFRFWSIEEKADVMTLAQLVIDTLKATLKFEAVIGYGTALGAARDGGLIPHDDDVDLICCVPVDSYPTIKAAKQAIRDGLSQVSGLRVFGDFSGHVKVSKGRLALDVFIAMEEGEFISSYPGPRRVILKDDVFPARPLEVYGVMVDAPCKMDEYLAKVYGADWRIPNPIFSHSWNGAKAFSDIIG